MYKNTWAKAKSVHFIPTFRISYTFTWLLDRELFGWAIFSLSFWVTHNMKSLNLWIIFLGVSFAHLCASQHTCPQINVTTDDEEYYKKDLEFAFEKVCLGLDLLVSHLVTEDLSLQTLFLTILSQPQDQVSACELWYYSHLLQRFQLFLLLKIYIKSHDHRHQSESYNEHCSPSSPPRAVRDVRIVLLMVEERHGSLMVLILLLLHLHKTATSHWLVPDINRTEGSGSSEIFLKMAICK